MSPRPLAPPAFLVPVLLLTACATGGAARHFAPATESEAREALGALAAAQRRAASLPAARLLYDARMGRGGASALPGTLAVTYDGKTVRRAALTGPFGARVAQYDAGELTGDDRRALVVDPAALTAVLAGEWPGEPTSVEGCDGGECLLLWEAPLRVSAVVDRHEERLRSLAIEGEEGLLDVTYGGRADPWPERVAAWEKRSGRILRLTLVTVEASTAAGTSRR